MYAIIVSIFACFFFSYSAHANSSISIANSGDTISFGDIKASSTGTMASATDELTITTDCSAGSNVYISAINDVSSSTNLVNNAATINNEISTMPGTTIGTTALALQNNTWGFNTVDDGTFYGLPTYANGTTTPIYAGTNTTIPIYYGAKVTNLLVPGKYTGQVLYTATVNTSCLDYTLQFNTNGATSSTLESQTHGVNDLIDLAAISSTSIISKTGYRLTGWKDQDNRSYGITGTVDVNPTNTTPVTLTAQWEVSTHTVTINWGDNVSYVTGDGTYKYGDMVELYSDENYGYGYHFGSWTVNSGGVTLGSTTSNSTTFTMPDNDVVITANAAKNTYTLVYNANGGTGSMSSQTVTYEEIVTARANGFSKASAEFLYWSLEPDDDGWYYEVGESMDISDLAWTQDVSDVNGATITLYAYWKNLSCLRTGGCRTADNRTWIFANSGNEMTFYDACPSYGYWYEGHNATCTACPSGYSFPRDSDYNNLIRAYGGTVAYATSPNGNYTGYTETTGALYNALGIGYEEGQSVWAWSSTESSTSGFDGVHIISIDSSSSSTADWGTSPDADLPVLCYK